MGSLAEERKGEQVGLVVGVRPDSFTGFIPERLLEKRLMIEFESGEFVEDWLVSVNIVIHFIPVGLWPNAICDARKGD